MYWILLAFINVIAIIPLIIPSLARRYGDIMGDTRRAVFMRAARAPTLLGRIFILLSPDEHDPLSLHVWFYLAILFFVIEVISFVTPYFLDIFVIIINNDWVTLFLVFTSLLLFRLRARYRFWYGTLEMFVGIAAIRTAVHTGQQISQNAPPIDLVLPRVLTVLSGVYVIIRGLDNMTQKLPDSLHKLWDLWFPGSRKA
jgi:hypothetical protein